MAKVIYDRCNLSALGNDLDLLQDTLENERKYVESAPEKEIPEFSDEEVNAAREVVYEYFRAISKKDDEAILKTLTSIHHRPNVQLYGEETRTLLSVEYNPDDPMRVTYVTSRRGSVNGIRKENVIVFKVSFSVKYPNGIITGPFNERDYRGWSHDPGS